MKHEAILAGEDYLPRDTRIDGPLQVGWEVTLKAGKHDPVKAIICWACGLESGGVFAEPVAL